MRKRTQERDSDSTWWLCWTRSCGLDGKRDKTLIKFLSHSGESRHRQRRGGGGLLARGNAKVLLNCEYRYCRFGGKKARSCIDNWLSLNANNKQLDKLKGRHLSSLAFKWSQPKNSFFSTNLMLWEKQIVIALYVNSDSFIRLVDTAQCGSRARAGMWGKGRHKQIGEHRALCIITAAGNLVESRLLSPGAGYNNDAADDHL